MSWRSRIYDYAFQGNSRCDTATIATNGVNRTEDDQVKVNIDSKLPVVANVAVSHGYRDEKCIFQKPRTMDEALAYIQSCGFRLLKLSMLIEMSKITLQSKKYNKGLIEEILRQHSWTIHQTTYDQQIAFFTKPTMILQLPVAGARNDPQFIRTYFSGLEYHESLVKLSRYYPAAVPNLSRLKCATLKGDPSSGSDYSRSPIGYHTILGPAHLGQEITRKEWVDLYPDIASQSIKAEH